MNSSNFDNLPLNDVKETRVTKINIHGYNTWQNVRGACTSQSSGPSNTAFHALKLNYFMHRIRI